MRIAFFTDTYLPNTDGVVTAICNYQKELEARGHEVYVFSPGTRKQKEENRNKRIFYLNSTSFKPYPDYRIAIFNYFSVIKLIKNLNIDVIHSHGIATTGLAAIQAAKKLNLKPIATFHTMVSSALHYLTSQPQVQHLLEGVSWKYLQWYYSGYKTVLVPTRFTEEILQKHNITNTRIQPSGITIADFENTDGEAFRKKYNLADKKIVLHVGRVAMEKNLELVIEQAENIINVQPGVHFVITGKGPAEGYYRRLVAEKKLEPHFLFTGYLPFDELKTAYSASDVFVFPSEFDTQGLAVLEAMASGVPAVAKKGCAAADYITHEKNGYLFSDRFDFHEKVLSAIENKKNLGESAKETARNFDIKKTTDMLLEVYEEISKMKRI